MINTHKLSKADREIFEIIIEQRKTAGKNVQVRPALLELDRGQTFKAVAKHWELLISTGWPLGAILSKRKTQCRR